MKTARTTVPFFHSREVFAARISRLNLCERTKMDKKMKLRERKMLGDYEVLQEVRLGGKLFLLGGDDRTVYEPYMTYCQKLNSLGSPVFLDLEAGNDYLEILGIFLSRLEEQKKAIEKFRAGRKIPQQMLNQSFCRPRGRDESLEEKLVILDPASLAPEYRTADCQLGFAVGGSGCYPDLHGRDVYFRELYSGEECRWDIADILGIADAEKLPEWAKRKLAEQKKMCVPQKRLRGETDD